MRFSLASAPSLPQDLFANLLTLSVQSAAPRPEARRTRVLVVEDELEIQRLVTWILTLEGFEVECASNGKEAIDRLEGPATHAAPDLILLDLLMPVIGGLEFLNWKRTAPERIQAIPVLVTTGIAEPQLPGELAVAGVLHKPLAADLLVHSIHRALTPRQTRS